MEAIELKVGGKKFSLSIADDGVNGYLVPPGGAGFKVMLNGSAVIPLQPADAGKVNGMVLQLLGMSAVAAKYGVA